MNLADFINSHEKNICHITFDDGHHSFEDAFKILKENKYSIYVIYICGQNFKKKIFGFKILII